jgi:head-tail adaptor
MTLFNAHDLAWMREQQKSLLPTACTISRRTDTAVGDGTFTSVWATASTTVCRDVATSGRELELAAKLTTHTARTVTLPHDADVRTADRIVIGARSLEVIALLGITGWITALRVLAVEVT